MKSLDLSPQEFQRLAQEVTGLAAAYLQSLDQRPSFPQTTGAETQRLFSGPLPESGMGPAALGPMAQILDHSRTPGPRFFGYVFGCGEPVAALGDLLASVVNQNVTAWRSAPAAVTVERTVVGWLAEGIGCRAFQGSLTGGGSSANLMGLAMAREAKAPANQQGARPAVVYASSEIHMSIPKAMALLGLGHANLRHIPVDHHYRMVPAKLEAAIAEDSRAGRKGIAVVASAGTVNTGAIDPLPEIAAIARRHGLWLHVDGAYGALAALAVPEKFAGLELADSVSLDAHKWLYQPVDCGCLLYRDPAAAQAAFAHTGDYAKSLSTDPVEGFAFFEESVELSRRFRALKLWLSLRYHGLAAFREAIARDLAHARRLADLVAARPELELMAPVELSAACFRLKPKGSEDEANRLNAAVLARVIRRGRVYISNASLQGRFALRACFVNHRTREADVQAIVDEVLAAAVETGAEERA
ncbi:MAG TPA: aminotransferase class V-fold PLP-dependent enzyme [Terriglobales bacterium]|jgi:glutamate/tyrosine decarboxylase-like PLP-dependent enzyme|nr:aminotransferase class V-fold PLP-dependent enzyme [Terriglobales bacterium]